MAVTKLNIDEFIGTASQYLLLDVRSPGEFAHAHIPHAVSLPIFSDEERKIVGTAYKQESREKAIKLGLDFFGKDLVKSVEAVESLLAERNDTSKTVALHCWRGGMRSGAMAWLLNLYGFNIYLLEGGYKAYRRWVLERLENNYPLRVLGGYTGSNKTGILQELKRRSQAVIDLEGLAAHQGSAFGNLDNIPQPSQEQFENELAQQLFRLKDMAVIWVEAESQRIGDLNIPAPFFQRMRSSPLLFLDVPFEERLSYLVGTYGQYKSERLLNGIMRIKKRLGGLETKTAINCLLEDDLRGCFSILLKYYDKVYLKSTMSRDDIEQLITRISSETIDYKQNTEKILQHV